VKLAGKIDLDASQVFELP